MPFISVIIRESKEVKFLKVSAGVRHWEGAIINGGNIDGELIPLRNADRWEPVIDLDTGKIMDWPNDKTANVCFKVCDDGVYTLLDSKMNVVTTIRGYVPDILSPAENGYGDYIHMEIETDGSIQDYSCDLSAFTEEHYKT